MKSHLRAVKPAPMGRPTPQLPRLTPYDMTKAQRERRRERPRNSYSLRPLIAYGLMCYGLGVLMSILLYAIFLR